MRSHKARPAAASNTGVGVAYKVVSAESAASAAVESPVARASDGAGSIRIPAAWCGLVGLTPSADRIAWRHAGKFLSEVEFVVARSLRDTAAFLDELRPARVREQEPGLYLASAAAHPGGGVHGGPGVIAARAALHAGRARTIGLLVGAAAALAVRRRP